jgi:hypothetical protein
MFPAIFRVEERGKQETSEEAGGKNYAALYPRVICFSTVEILL